MNVVCVIKKGNGGTGVSHAARYISTRDRDEQREGVEARKLFSAGDDKLNYPQANHLLGNGREPNANEVLHVVISLEKEDDFNRLGTDEESKQAGVRETTRNALKEMANFFNVDELRWVAGIHRNTDNPHVHLLIHRDYVERETGRQKRLNALQRDLRLSWSSTPGGERVHNPGVLSLAFGKHLERNIERAQGERKRNDQKLSGDRLILGKAMVAKDNIERLQEVHEAAITYGEHRRYRIVDARGQSRWLSEHDLRLRAEAKANLEALRLTSDWKPEARRELRNEVFAQEIERYKPTINKIREMRREDLEWTELKLQQSVDASQLLFSRAKAISREYQKAGSAIPTPILTRSELARLQERAILNGDTERLRNLEEIRMNLAAEKDSPTRTDGEMGRLRAQQFVACSALMVERKALGAFEETKHIRPWTVGDGMERGSLFGERANNSLAAIEKALAQASDQAKFIGARRLHWDDQKRGEARERVDELSERREQFLQKIHEERTNLTARITQKAEMVNALNEISAREEARYLDEDRKRPAPIFTEQEMKEIAAHAERRRDPQFYQTLIELEREHDARAFRGLPILPVERVGRVMAREVMAGIAVREAQARLQKFTDQRDQVTVIVKDDSSQEIGLARMADVKPRTPLEHLFRPLIERSEKYRRVAIAVDNYGNRLAQRYEETSAIHAILKEDAHEYEREFARQNPGMAAPRPQFTAGEIGKLELQALKETDPALRENYETLYRESLANSHDNSGMRTSSAVRKEYSRTIAVDGREAANILNSFGTEGFIDPERGVGNRSDDFAEQFDLKQAMSFER
jgi:hypothetical protein